MGVYTYIQICGDQMNSLAVEMQLVRIAQKHIGDWGEQFIRHQCDRLGLNIKNLTSEDLRKLAKEASQTAVIVVGKKRASGLYSDIMKLSERV